MADSLSLSSHQSNLQRLCRVCGSILTGRKHDVKEYLIRLAATFQIDFGSDSIFIHPTHFCHQCYAAMPNSEKRGTPDINTVRIWGPHEVECDTCTHLKHKSQGGRPKKRKGRNGGRPPAATVDKPASQMTASDILSLSPSKPIPSIVDQCISHVMNIKIKQSDLPNHTVQLPTKGPQVFIKNLYYVCKCVYTT